MSPHVSLYLHTSHLRKGLNYKLAEVSSTDPCPNPNTNPINQVFQPYSAADYKSLFA